MGDIYCVGFFCCSVFFVGLFKIVTYEMKEGDWFI